MKKRAEDRRLTRAAKAEKTAGAQFGGKRSLLTALTISGRDR
jgi:hypothetical protein